MIDCVTHLELWLPAMLCIAMSVVLAVRGEGPPRREPRSRASGDIQVPPVQLSARSAFTTSAHATGSGAKGATRLTRSAKRP